MSLAVHPLFPAALRRSCRWRVAGHVHLADVYGGELVSVANASATAVPTSLHLAAPPRS